MTNENAQTDSFRLIRCYIENESYGLDMSWIHSIQRTDRVRLEGGRDLSPNDDPVRSVCNAEDLVGWLDVEGRETPIFSLASRLGRPIDRTVPMGRKVLGGGSQRVVVLHPPESVEGNGGAGSLALLVDRVSQVIQIPLDLVIPLPPIVRNPRRTYFDGVIWLHEEMVLLLSIENLLSDTALHASLAEDPVKAVVAEATSGDEARHVEKPARFNPNSDGRRVSPGQIVVFNLHKRFQGRQTFSFGLSISQVPEILEPLPMIRVPGAPAFVLGLLRWRDRPVPLIDLASRLKMSVEEGPSTNGNTRLIVVRDRAPGRRPSTPSSGVYKDGDGGDRNDRGVLAAFMIQPVVRILRLPIACQPYVEELPFESAMLHGVVTTESEMLVIPDVQSVLWRDE